MGRPCRLTFLFALAGSVAALTTPPLTDYVTYLGGSGAESVAGIAVDSSGSEYVAGTTNSPDFPLTSTGFGSPTASNDCAFITKFNPAGTGIAFSVCVANSQALAFGMDAAGYMYLATQSISGTYTLYSVYKIDPAGKNIIYRTLLGAAPESMAVDAAGNVYLAGTAGAGFGTTGGVYQPQLAPGICAVGSGVKLGQAPCNDAFAMKLSPSGAPVWATYLGGSSNDDAHAIAVDSAGSVWVAGETLSPSFPVTSNALESKFHGEVDLGPVGFGDAFVAKFDATGGHLLYATYLGGSAPDGAFAIAVDSANSAYVTGGTQSTDFPTTAGALQTAYSGAPPLMPGLLGNAFATKFLSSGTVAYSTYLGGFRGTSIAVDATGEAAVNSAPNATLNCSGPAAVSIINAAGSAIAASSPVVGQYLAWGINGGLYSAGFTYTLAFLTTPHSYQTQYGGGSSDAYAGKVDFTQAAGPALASVVNAATLIAGGGEVAPGEIVTLFGSGFGSQSTVNFDGVASPVFYASNCQINTVVPFGVTSNATSVSVQAGQLTIGPVQLPVVPADPGIFTDNGTGTGQAAVVNQDGSIDSASNPAPRGTVVAVYMTGVGVLQSVTSSLGSVVFAGQAPGLIVGGIQVNIQIPMNAPTGAAVPFRIGAGGYNSQSVTLAVQ